MSKPLEPEDLAKLPFLWWGVWSDVVRYEDVGLLAT